MYDNLISGLLKLRDWDAKWFPLRQPNWRWWQKLSGIANVLFPPVFLLLFLAFALHLWMDIKDARGPGCAKIVKSKDEAQHAVSAFFLSDTKFARRIIRALRRDGLTDEYLARLKAGCQGCYYRTGETRFFEDPDIWYFISSIAPEEARRSVEFRVDCAINVSIQKELFGG